jgi:dipeptidyl aminopeptidase/acylaminoacyl peptidase
MVDSPDGARTDIRVVLPGGTKTLWSGNRMDRYEDPGRPVRIDGLDGPILEAGGSIFLAGSGLTTNGVQPFLERLDLVTGESRRVFTADANMLETVLAVLDPAAEIILTHRETATAPPVYRRVQPGRATELYRTPNPYPQLEQVKRQRISYPRADGVTLSGTLYLPENAGAAPLPTLIWIYPLDLSARVRRPGPRAAGGYPAVRF